MADNTAAHNEGLWMPYDIWAIIASFLDNDDLARFRQLCSATQFVGSDVFILQPLYNRLYAIDNTLSPLLPQDGALAEFKKAFEKIQTRQQSEISYLTQHHPVIMAKSEYVQVLQENTAMSLKALETKSTLLDEINIEIIKIKINVHNTTLDLSHARITRLPIALFKAEGYVHFWQNLTHLYCSNNQLTTLNLQGLMALQVLACCYNQLATLNLQGLVTLQWLWCQNNQLTSLDVQELAALQGLNCDDNQLTSLDVQGLAALQVLWCGYNQLTTLNLQELVALQKLRCNNNQLTTLDLQGLAALQELWCLKNQLTSLNVQGLAALQVLSCSDNQLTSLDVQELAALQQLWCNNNPLKTLILTGVPESVKNQYAELERSLLFKKLSQTNSIEARRAIIRRLGADYTPENCGKYLGPVYAAQLFVSDLASSTYSFTSSALSQASAFLPSFGENQLKIKRDEDEVDTEELSEEPDNQPPAKKRKRK